MRHRPRFDNWSAKFVLEIDDELMTLETAHELLNKGGKSQGIGDFRPNKRGPFGRFLDRRTRSQLNFQGAISSNVREKEYQSQRLDCKT
jgi:hypothetical protein